MVKQLLGRDPSRGSPSSASTARRRGRSRRCSATQAWSRPSRRSRGRCAGCSRQSRPRRPLVVVFDDIHWGEEAFLDLVDHVADLSRDAPILLLCMARPELLDRRPNWGGGKLNATTVLLEPLAAGDAESLVASLLDGEAVDESLRARILDAAEGNPLFAEEMVALVRESPGDVVAVPPTIQALLAARLDQLDQSERNVLERGSVEGRTFHRGAVQALSPTDEQLLTPLTALVRRELLRPDRPQFPGEDAFRFRHLLIRDAAYDALPKASRARAPRALRRLDRRARRARRAGRGSRVSPRAGAPLPRRARHLRRPARLPSGRSARLGGRQGRRARRRAGRDQPPRSRCGPLPDRRTASHRPSRHARPGVVRDRRVGSGRRAVLRGDRAGPGCRRPADRRARDPRQDRRQYVPGLVREPRQDQGRARVADRRLRGVRRRERARPGRRSRWSAPFLERPGGGRAGRARACGGPRAECRRQAPGGPVPAVRPALVEEWPDARVGGPRAGCPAA